jgi:hypothetical protein
MDKSKECLQETDENIVASKGICYLYRILAAGFGVLLLALLIIGFFTQHGVNSTYLMPYLFVYLLILATYGVVFAKLYKWDSELKIICAIFMLAAIPRLLLVFLKYDFYQPTSDFLNYLRFGQLMLQGNYEDVAHIISLYQIPTMGGLAIYNGLIAGLFSPTVVGFQISNVITTSLICVFIYQIGKTINRKVALGATMFFTLYLANIVSTQITLNQHPAILFLLISMYFLQKLIVTDKKSMVVLHVVLSTIFISIAGFMHGSPLVFWGAYLGFAGVVLFTNINKQAMRSFFCFRTKAKEQSVSMCKKMVLFICVFSIGFIMLTQIGLQLIYSRGVINSLESYTFLRHFVIGLDVESNGTLMNNESFTRFLSYPEGERQEAAVKIIREQLQSPGEISILIAHKTYRAWFGNDSIFYWYTRYQVHQHLQVPEEEVTEEQLASFHHMVHLRDVARDVDQVTVQLLLFFVALGLLLKAYSRADDMYYLQLIVVIGMFVTVGLGEMQPRYRYPAMPPLAILASVGLFEVIRITEALKTKVCLLLQQYNRRKT